jgi:hypothetical protein
MIYILSVLLVVLEIIADKYLWKIGKLDKPITTIIRVGLILLIASFYDFWPALLLVISVHWMLFDFSLNISRWNELPARKFLAKLFYHGHFKEKFSYDWFFQRIPPQMELLMKGILFGVALYYYG